MHPFIVLLIVTMVLTSACMILLLGWCFVRNCLTLQSPNLQGVDEVAEDTALDFLDEEQPCTLENI
jgi:hypothetical protein